MKPLSMGRILLLLLLSNILEAQLLVEGETLKRILEGLHTCKIQLKGADTLSLGQVCPGKQLVVESSGSVIQDIRLSLFPEEVKKGALQPVYQFIERYWLDLLLQTHTDQMNSMRGDFVVIRVNGGNFSVSGYTVKDILQQIDLYTPFSLQSDTAAFKVTWHPQGTINGIEMVFQKQYDLILGKDKKELSHLLVRDLQAYKQKAEKRRFILKTRLLSR